MNNILHKIQDVNYNLTEEGFSKYQEAAQKIMGYLKYISDSIEQSIYSLYLKEK